MSYLIKKDFVIAFVHDKRMQSAKVRLKLSGLDSTLLFNQLAAFDRMTAYQLVCTQAESIDSSIVLPQYQQHLSLVEGSDHVFKRIEQLLAVDGVKCRVVHLIDRSSNTASVFWTNHSGHVSVSVLDTDKESLNKQTIFVRDKRLVENLNYGTHILVTENTYEVDDGLLCNNMYTLHSRDAEILVMREKQK